MNPEPPRTTTLAEAIDKDVINDLKQSTDSVEKLGDWKEKDRLKKEAKKKQRLDKITQKRQQIYMDRRNRLLASGVPADKVDMSLAAEDYHNLSDSQKIKRLEGILSSTFQNFAKELNNLRHNDTVLADAMDVNFKAFSKMLVKVGVPLEEQQTFIQDAQKEMNEERAMEIAAKHAATKAKADASEKSRAEEALKEAESRIAADVAAEELSAVPTPEGATEFGG
jgi:hypothetical protein